MTPTVLVLSTVHAPDDTRIREKLIRSLASDFTVRYATRSPGPTNRDGVEVIELSGGRIRRNLRAWRLGLFGRYDILSLHDPEMLLLGITVRLLRWRRRVVFDVHEDIPAQIRTKAWLPRPLRPAVAWTTHRLLRLAERLHALTLAEPGYRHLFKREHPVFPNHLDADRLPQPSAERVTALIYVGDVTDLRGTPEAVAAAGRAGVKLHVVGPVTDRMRSIIESTAAEESAEVVLHGRLPHAEAMEVARSAMVGISPLRDIPNYRHSQPTKILEYLAMGLPVVATDLPGTRLLVTGLDAVWLVPPEDSRAMVDAIGEAATDTAVAAATAQAPAVRDLFRWPAVEVARFYRDLVN